MTAMPPRRAARPEAVSSVAPIALLSRLWRAKLVPLPRNDHRTPTTSDIPPNPLGLMRCPASWNDFGTLLRGHDA
jgi:hypothetical protein